MEMSTEFVLADLQLGEGGRGGGRRSRIKSKEDILYTKRMSKVFFILPTCLMVLITNCISTSSEALDCRES